MFAKFLSCDLIDRNGIGETYARLRESIGASEPKCAARMSGVVEETILVPKALDDGEVLTMTLKGSESGRHFVSVAWLGDIRIPTFLGDAPTKAQKDHALGRSLRLARAIFGEKIQGRKS